MALIKCPDCQREVSSQAASCPQCGHPINVLPPVIPTAPIVMPPLVRPRSSASGFGTFLIVVAVILLIIGFTQTQETRLEELTKGVQSTADEGRTARRLVGGRDTEGFQESYDSASRELDTMKSDRNQRMLLFFGGAAVCFIAGVICKSR